MINVAFPGMPHFYAELSVPGGGISVLLPLNVRTLLCDPMVGSDSRIRCLHISSITSDVRCSLACQFLLCYFEVMPSTQRCILRPPGWEYMALRPPGRVPPTLRPPGRVSHLTSSSSRSCD